MSPQCLYWGNPSRPGLDRPWSAAEGTAAVRDASKGGPFGALIDGRFRGWCSRARAPLRAGNY